MTANRLAGRFSVEDSARLIRHYRYVEERLMRILGGWIALTPEVPVKLLFGRHVWDCVQHADRWGKRLPELRAPAQQSEAPGEAFARFVDSLEAAEAFQQTPERLAGVYRVLKPCLLAAYERHLAVANPIYEPPTRRILATCAQEERRHIAAGDALLRQLAATPELSARVTEWVSAALARLGETAGVAGDGDLTLAPLPGPGEVSHVGQDLVAVERPAERWPIPDDLAEALDVHGRALLAGDLAAAAGLVSEPAWATARAVYAEAMSLGVSAAHVVACSRLGHQWVVKQRAQGARGVCVLQARWARDSRGWRIAEVEIVRRGPAA